MKKIYRFICGRYRKFEKTLVRSIICGKCKNKDGKKKKKNQMKSKKKFLV